MGSFRNDVTLEVEVEVCQFLGNLDCKEVFIFNKSKIAIWLDSWVSTDTIS